MNEIEWIDWKKAKMIEQNDLVTISKMIFQYIGKNNSNH